MDDSPAKIPGRAPTRLRKGRCCLALLALLALVFVICTLVSSTRLDGRVHALRAEIEQERAARGDGSRPVISGEPVAGNAADDYLALEWVFGPRKEWETAPPPNLPRVDLAMGAGVDVQVGLIAHDIEEMRRGKRDAFSPEADAAYAQFGGLTRNIRDGLRRGRVDLPFEPERGAYAPIVDLISVRHGASLLTYEAEKAAPDEAVRIGAEIVAFGRDIGSSPYIITQMMAVAIRSIGLRTIERALRRPVSREPSRARSSSSGD